MRYALIIVFGVCYYAGWLPASFVVPALLVISALRLPDRKGGRSPRRGGYIAPPSPVSSGENPGMVDRVRTYTGFSTRPGSPSAGEAVQDLRVALNKPGAVGSYMSEWGFSPGRLTTAADVDWSRVPGDWKAAGDCGCGDTAA